MEPLTPQPVSRWSALLGWMLLTGMTGCTTTGGLCSCDAPPVGPACQVAATWNNQVMYSPDPAHNGTPCPGIGGRLYLFGPQVDFPLAADGCVVVDLFDLTALDPQKVSQPLEEWRFDKDTLKRLQKRDAIGWGYTLFLPWGTYRSDITRVQLKVRYEPKQGTPLYDENAPMTLNREAGSPPGVAGANVGKVPTVATGARQQGLVGTPASAAVSQARP
jgi:hypothetical protein